MHHYETTPVLPVLFTENLKIADMLLTNCRLLLVLPHFEIHNLGWGDKTIKEVCSEHRVDIPTFLLICNLYSFESAYVVSNTVLEQIPIENILLYQQAFHKWMLETRLLQIRELIMRLEKNFQQIIGNLMSDMGLKYERIIEEHIHYEEQTVFPYIRQLLKGENTGSYTIDDYINAHENIEDTVNDLQNIILRYVPPLCTIDMAKDLLFNLFMFDYALQKHQIIEDEIIIPIVKKLEQKREADA